MPSTLLWFRRDLRLHDLPPLLEAAADDAEVLGCFVLDPRLEKSAGPRRLQFLGDSLRALSDALAGRLLITRGRPEQRIPLLCREIEATEVHVSADFSPFGVRRDEAVAAALTDAGVALRATGSPYLVSPGRVTKDDGTPYKVFTPYLARWREIGWRAPAPSATAAVNWIDPAALPSEFRVDAPDPGAELDIEAGEAAALDRWAEFVDSRLADYAEDRNRPDRPGISRMSAHLKFGTIHPRTMAADLDFRADGPGAYLRELAFRDFYAAVLHQWPDSAWRNWNRTFDTIEVDTDDGAAELFDAWKRGRTGYPIVDAGMRQLRESGFMHNRVRMIVASFLVKDLHLPWQWGARWFLEQLVDGDIANNQHGWQWCAGSGTDAAPYFRVFNPTTQGQKFDPDGDYVRRWVLELADVDDVHKLKGGRPADYPDPIVEHAAERAEALRRYGRIG
ncbi:deoxyribodipyrimidine photo-lyase [Mycobacterium sp. CVI_P3]|uniref:Deoxyribodipyrimidine photo-lyase n=1 Tax=Mycobacterium pinniadriaticum TaxID=2994102 RepID=A0ABT3SBS0_9MYCO|nr:deoxyribodipyrimidine photo-lyase [Mycobacterium pinniadriaticum]MCX2930537.1 deoxyribodipyrimidine photo-lyase [Mycobacterium pinniadriaticum]MCX2936961.1 deoxyribodipyrimidine photo-lyase [Mycobacterium pinniadriaticum]